MLFLVPVVFIVAWIAGCQSVPRAHNAPKSLPSVGQTIVLHQSLTVQAGSTRVYMQDGKPLNFSHIDIYRPWCQFYLYEHPDDLKDKRTINPDIFSVIESYNLDEVFIAHRSTIVASSGWLLSDSSSGDVGPRTLQSIMKLKSINQPQVTELKCVIFDDPVDNNYLSIRQMQLTLGDLVTLAVK